jgi:hypothetical protein
MTMVEGPFVKSRTIYAALTVLAISTPAGAQGFPPYEVLTIVRSTGLEPLSRPVRHGPDYVLHAVDRRDREVRVIVDARSGRIVSVTPVVTASRISPPPRRGGVTMGPYERMEPGYVPEASPDVYEDDEPMMDNDPRAPRPPGAVPGAVLGAQQPSSGALPPRGAISRSDLPPPAGSRIVTAAPPPRDGLPSSEPRVITATQPGPHGVLPPPPERFPQRATTPAVKPKPPVKRAAAGPPAQTPLPKPKPAISKTEAAPSPPPADKVEAWPQPAAESKPVDASSLPN